MIMILPGARTFIFDVDRAIETVAGIQPEQFEGERAIRLFQLRTWMLFPDRSSRRDMSAVKAAGMIAAAKFLERIEEDIFCDVDARRRRDEGDDFPMVDPNDRPPQTLATFSRFRDKGRPCRYV